MIKRVVLTQLTNYLEQSSLLTDNQHGIVKGVSTTTAIISLIEQVIKQLEDGKHVTYILLHFSKAFESLGQDSHSFKTGSTWYIRNDRYVKVFLNILMQSNYYCLNSAAHVATTVLGNIYVNCLRKQITSCQIDYFPFSDHNGLIYNLKYTILRGRPVLYKPLPTYLNEWYSFLFNMILYKSLASLIGIIC